MLFLTNLSEKTEKSRKKMSTVKYDGSGQKFCKNCFTSRAKVRKCILEAFSGPPDCGEYSPSYQKTVNCIQMRVLSQVSQVLSFFLLMFYLTIVKINSSFERTKMNLSPLAVLRRNCLVVQLDGLKNYKCSHRFSPENFCLLAMTIMGENTAACLIGYR